jgi:hypothetical protein
MRSENDELREFTIHLVRLVGSRWGRLADHLDDRGAAVEGNDGAAGLPGRPDSGELERE